MVQFGNMKWQISIVVTLLETTISFLLGVKKSDQRGLFTSSPRLFDFVSLSLGLDLLPLKLLKMLRFQRGEVCSVDRERTAISAKWKCRFLRVKYILFVTKTL